MGGSQSASGIAGCAAGGGEGKPCCNFMDGEGEIPLAAPEQDPVLARGPVATKMGGRLLGSGSPVDSTPGTSANPIFPEGRKATSAAPASDETRVSAEQLACKGVTVKQLLEFYGTMLKWKRINAKTLTRDIVREIILPETKESKSCYMESVFMLQRGGAHRATTFVSHSWQVPFQSTVLNILLDASGWPAPDLLAAAFPAAQAADGEDAPEISVDQLMRSFSKDVYNSTYWLCIFAVNQHTSICGDCPGCRGEATWSAKQFTAATCPVCGKEKYCPCSCGSAKHGRGEPHYELDVLADVAKQMGGLMVSLDPSLAALERLWVLREAGEAHRGIPLAFRAAVGLDEAATRKLQGGSLSLPAVEVCKATSAEDRRRILAEIDSMQGGRAAFRDFVSCMVELSFGLCKGLGSTSEAVTSGLARVPHLEFDLRWCGDTITNLATLDIGSEKMSRLAQLRVLKVNMAGCSRVSSLGALGSGLGMLRDLRELTLDFRGCRSLSDVKPVGLALRRMTALKELTLSFADCTALVDVSTIGQMLAELKALQELRIDFAFCSGLAGVQSLAVGLSQLKELSELSLILLQCSKVTDDDLAALAKSLPQELESLTLDLNWCSQVGDASMKALAKSLPHTIAELKVNLLETGVRGPGVRALADMMPPFLKKLAALLPSQAGAESGARLREAAKARGCKDIQLF